MQFITTEHYDQLSNKAAMIIAGQVSFKKNSVIGLATGSSPIGVYKSLVHLYKNDYIDFSEVSTLNLDEYLGIDPMDEQSYASFMRKNLFQNFNICTSNTHIPQSNPADVDAECIRYEQLIKHLGRIDLQLLGIGQNGHIGFNEPAAHFERETHVVELDQRTLQSNARYFESIDLMPKQAITVGIGTIMKARKIVLLASGHEKSEILDEAFFGPVTPAVPASILQFHPDVTVVADQAAMQVISRKGRL